MKPCQDRISSLERKVYQTRIPVYLSAAAFPWLRKCSASCVKALLLPSHSQSILINPNLACGWPDCDDTVVIKLKAKNPDRRTTGNLLIDPSCSIPRSISRSQLARKASFVTDWTLLLEAENCYSLPGDQWLGLCVKPRQCFGHTLSGCLGKRPSNAPATGFALSKFCNSQCWDLQIEQPLSYCL